MNEEQALIASPFRILILNQDALKCFADHVIDNGEDFVVALTCKPMRRAVITRHKERGLPGTKPVPLLSETTPVDGLTGAFRTPVAAIASSASRLAWAKSLGPAGPYWLRRWGLDTSHAVARAGSLQALQWTRREDCARDEWTCCEWDEWTCADAAASGHLSLLRWARENGCPWNASTCADAARGGHLDILQWARANGCEWEERTCAMAAYGGHLEVLQWARANGCEWSVYTCHEAARGGHLEVLQWARANGCEWDAET